MTLLPEASQNAAWNPNGPEPHDNLRPALRALIDASGAAAGAVCLFDTEGAVLRLAVEVGLSDEGCHVLRTMRADASVWDAPLVCHLEQAPSILEDTPDQPIPPLIEAAGPISTVACVPLNAGGLEVGTAILVSTPPHFLTAERLPELADKVGEVEQAVHRLHKEVAVLARRDRSAASRLDMIADVAFGWVDVSTRATEHLLVAMRRRSWIATVIERLGGSGARYADRLRRLEAKTQALWRHLRLLEITQREQEATDTALRARLYDSEARLARQRQRLNALTRDEKRATTVRDSGRGAENGAEETVESIIERSLADGEEALLRALEGTERAARQAAVAIGEEGGEAGADPEDGTAERLGFERTEEQLRTRLYDAEARLARERERGRALESSRKHIAAELVAVLSRERQMRNELEHARSRGDAGHEPADLQCTKLIETAISSGYEPAGDHAEQRDTSPNGVQARQAGGDVAGGLADPVEIRGMADGSMRSTTPSTTCAVVVIDDDPVWTEDEIPDMEVRVVRPGSGMAARLADMDATYIVANLATPGVFASLAELRALGCKTPFWGCLAARHAAEAAIVGQVEPGASPLDVDAVLAWLDSFALRGTRVMIAGANVNAFISLREALARDGFSVSVAWDVKQAGDLLEMVRPQVAILDLDLPPRGGHRLVAQIAGMDPQPMMLLLPGRGDATAFSRVLRDNTGDIPCLTRGLCLANIEANLYWLAQKNGSAHRRDEGCAGTRAGVTDPPSAIAGSGVQSGEARA